MRQRRGERVLGPYAFRGGHRLTFVAANGARSGSRVFPTEQEALAEKRRIEREIASRSAVTISEAIEKYEADYLIALQSNTKSSATTTVHRLESFFFGQLDHSLSSLNPFACQRLYKQARERVRPSTGRPAAVDTHRNELAESKTFLDWCVRERLMPSNPLSGVSGVGRRKHGEESKPQLRIDEFRFWMDLAEAYADTGEDGAIAAMMGPILDMRAGEIVSRRVRDLDDDGQVIWTKSKTEAGRRRLRIHYAPLSAYLKQLAKDRKSDAWLFPARSASGHRYRDWVREWVQRICRETGVMIVSAHSMRGLHSTLATEEGETSAAIAKALGHGDPRVTEQSYIRPEALRGARQARVLKAVKGTRQ